MKTDAFFSDETEEYVIPSEPEPGQIVRIRFRVAKNEGDRVEFVEEGDRTATRMFLSGSDSYFDY